LLRETDTPHTLSAAAVDALEARARGGDWERKKEFAAAWLYVDDPVWGCDRLTYGYHCRALASRRQAGTRSCAKYWRRRLRIT